MNDAPAFLQGNLGRWDRLVTSSFDNATKYIIVLVGVALGILLRSITHPMSPSIPRGFIARARAKPIA
jgi:hypothetical protein